jgi:hypothetical protein
MADLDLYGEPEPQNLVQLDWLNALGNAEKLELICEVRDLFKAICSRPERRLNTDAKLFRSAVASLDDGSRRPDILPVDPVVSRKWWKLDSGVISG